MQETTPSTVDAERQMSPAGGVLSGSSHRKDRGPFQRPASTNVLETKGDFFSWWTNARAWPFPVCEDAGTICC
jgi:hypothetical protein